MAHLGMFQCNVCTENVLGDFFFNGPTYYFFFNQHLESNLASLLRKNYSKQQNVYLHLRGSFVNFPSFFSCFI